MIIRRRVRSFSALLASLAALSAGACEQKLPTDPAVDAPSFDVTAGLAPSELFISEYIEGSSNNKALEIYNGTGTTVDLAADAYSIQVFYNGSASPGLTIQLTGSVASGDVYVLAQSSAGPAILAQADQTNGAGWFNGDDAVVLRRDGVVVDAIGQIGTDPGSAWVSGDASTQNRTLRRSAAVCSGDTDPDDPFDPALQWEGFPQDVFDGLGSHVTECGDPAEAAPAVATTMPAAGSSGAAVDSDIVIGFSEPVAVSEGWFSLVCSAGGEKTASVQGGAEVFTLKPDEPFVGGEVCTLTVQADAVTDLDSDDPPNNLTEDYAFSFLVAATAVCGEPFTPAWVLQGDGAATPFPGQTVTTEGVVVGDYEGPSPALRGFYLQDQTGDADPATSDAVFVFNGNEDDVDVGDIVRVTGTVEEFFDQTQIGGSTVQSCGPGGTVEPTDVVLPVTSDEWLERFEGMLVRFPQTLYVTEHFQLGRFGQVVMSSEDRLRQPTNAVAPGGPALALQEDNDRNRIIVDDALNQQNPDPIELGRGGAPLSPANTLRGGDSATGLVGVLSYTWSGNRASGNAYRLRPLGALGGGSADFQASNARPLSPPNVGGSLRVAAFNVLNYFNTFSGCTAGVGGVSTGCRGADDAAELDRQADKIVSAVVELDADVLGIIEIENDGYGPASAIADLVDRINAVTGTGSYAFIDADAGTGQQNALGVDAIKVGLIYKPARVTPVGTTAALNSPEFVNGGDAEIRNRASLAQAFETLGGGRFVANVNHFKSKGSPCETPDAGDGQGNCNEVRVAAAEALRDWLANDPTATGEADVLILGDLNAYANEDPIVVLEDAGYTDLLEAFEGPDAYTYVFDGQWGYLDYALASPNLAMQLVGAGAWHINADEPGVLDYNTNFKSPGQQVSLYDPSAFRSSDHDPVVVGVNLAKELDPQGLLPPIRPLPDLNREQAGRSVPVKFSLGGDEGLDVLAPGAPASIQMSCETGEPTGVLESTQSPGQTSLVYDPTTREYRYLWQTSQSWAGQCRDLVVRFKDGSVERARFSFR